MFVLRKVIGFSAAALCVFFFLDGLADVFYRPLAGFRSTVHDGVHEREIRRNAIASKGSIADDLSPFFDIKADTVAGIGDVPKPMSRGELTIVAGGRRLAPGEALVSDKPKVLIFGASSTFGLYNTAGGTIAANLGRLMPDRAVMNYATAGQRMVSNAAHLEQLLRQGMTADTVVFVVGALESLYQCVLLPKHRSFEDDRDNFRLENVYLHVEELFRPREVPFPCATSDEEARAVVGRILVAFRALVATAEAHNLKVAVIVPPSPQAGHPDVSNLSESTSYRLFKKGVGRTNEFLRQSLATNPIPFVYDLSTAFDGKPPYFLDGDGHVSDEGQRLLASTIRDILLKQEADYPE